MQVTPSQTIGPFYWGTIVKAYRADLAPPGVAGERIELALTLHDTNGAVVPDGLFEIWQANSHGRYNHPEDRRNLPLDAGFEGYGRASTFTDGLLNRVATRLYFDGDPANDEDPVLKSIDAARRATLIAKRDGQGVWRLPIHLGGAQETVFFDV